MKKVKSALKEDYKDNYLRVGPVWPECVLVEAIMGKHKAGVVVYKADLEKALNG